MGYDYPLIIAVRAVASRILVQHTMMMVMMMPKLTTLSLSLLLLSFISGSTLTLGNEQKTWCVAKPSSDQATLLGNINYACSQSQVDCRILQRGCPCFSPDNLINHASIAMNLYYQSKGRNHWNCDFRGSALIVVTDPSYANCIYA
ncbi:major pollen allergen Ole e 10 [Alnus glutinosa]|uniref:major pollen allergen Ole e 10 n=1 Tax=Alnus glutinosa TaxID=3517 RepID=UPI002D79BF2E|nr:major pollen allergen Ole e 10 [Alnus glutinosa]